MMAVGNKIDALPIKEEKVHEFVDRLTEWGEKNLRSFPWRRTSDPYRILLAEVMLHRTKAEQVAPVYLSFIDVYPSPEVLAKTPLRKISSSLRPLGLAYRAQRLKQLAKILVKQYGGQVPSDYDALRQLPGVGPYTANAILCFAFEKSLPILDSNIVRLLGRVFSIPIPQNPHKSRLLWRLAAKITPQDKARAFNLAMLDLAALVCTPRNPIHNNCPLNEICDRYSVS